jgi:hypothetical protein
MISSLKSKNNALSDELKKKEFIIKLKDERILQLENRLKKSIPDKENPKIYNTYADSSTTGTLDLEHIRILTENESKIKSQLFSKDKIISELENKLRDLERQLNTQKLQILDKNENSASMEHEQTREKFNSYNRMLGESEGKMNQLKNEKLILEQKLNQLVEIIKNQSHELKVNFIFILK